MARVRTDVPAGFIPDDNSPLSAASPDTVSFGPKEIQAAYNIPSGGDGVTVGIVDAYDNPNAEADLAVFRSHYGLAPCTTANGCFRKVDQNGGTSYPAGNTDWGGEIALDLDAVSSACPRCKILLVEAEDTGLPQDDPMVVAEDTAVALGATFISNSWGTNEATKASEGILLADATSSATHFNHPGVAFFVASGDAGFATDPNNTGDQKGADFPADIPGVFAVGGTTLVRSKSSARGWAEKVWGPDDGASNSGCSAFFSKPSYQASSPCSKGRLVADLSAVADPDTGLLVYDTYGGDGWQVIGGTSLASPTTAAIFAASGLTGVEPSFVYAHAADFNDVTSGTNGTCKTKLLCTGEVGYDAPTGVGTPDGAKLMGE